MERRVANSHGVRVAAGSEPTALTHLHLHLHLHGTRLYGRRVASRDVGGSGNRQQEEEAAKVNIL
uniref:Uncharacterized protein n=1 Tax=Oryza glaberrima TaxID=4538 RepID=I1QAQ1_ORYGL